MKTVHNRQVLIDFKQAIDNREDYLVPKISYKQPSNYEHFYNRMLFKKPLMFNDIICYHIADLLLAIEDDTYDRYCITIVNDKPLVIGSKNDIRIDSYFSNDRELVFKLSNNVVEVVFDDSDNMTVEVRIKSNDDKYEDTYKYLRTYYSN